MKYGQQIQGAIYQILLKTSGDLKDKYEELQNLITISQVGQLGAGGTSQTGTL